jgi:hypothetical protein
MQTGVPLSEVTSLGRQALVFATGARVQCDGTGALIRSRKQCLDFLPHQKVNHRTSPAFVLDRKDALNVRRLRRLFVPSIPEESGWPSGAHGELLIRCRVVAPKCREAH